MWNIFKITFGDIKVTIWERETDFDRRAPASTPAEVRNYCEFHTLLKREVYCEVQWVLSPLWDQLGFLFRESGSHLPREKEQIAQVLLQVVTLQVFYPCLSTGLLSQDTQRDSEHIQK